MSKQWQTKKGLKFDLIQSKIKAAEDAKMPPLDVNDGDMVERDAHYTSEAIVNFLTAADFSITQLKAPIILEDLNTPAQSVDVKMETLMGDKAPLFKTLKKIGAPIPGIGTLISQLENAVKMAVKPLLKDGATLPGLQLGKDGGGLQATGYVFIGEDPDSQGSFNVDDKDGQRDFTTVKIFKEDLERIK
jgi:hypothetical protein